MTDSQPGLRALVEMIGFALVAVLLNMLLCAKPAAAQCGAVGDGTDTECGKSALANNTGSFDSAFGSDALTNNTTGNYNTASGFEALVSNSTGDVNTANGAQALLNNTTGSGNTAIGFDALAVNSTGNDNTASGFGALYGNSTGTENTASGSEALDSNTTGNYNSASGAQALFSNGTGSSNTASGYQTLLRNTTGIDNTANGVFALFSNTTGGFNTAVGYEALWQNTGKSNLGLGYEAGQNLTSGSNNIDIANSGVARESGVIRIGASPHQTKAYIAGITGVQVTGGLDVVVNSNGQLGTTLSSRRYKRDITDMGELSSALMKLRPVTFHYKNDPHNERQYGLVAEEVAPVYPELVTYDLQGRVESVRYSMLTSMLLNELQKENRQLQQVSAQAAKTTVANATLRDEVRRQIAENHRQAQRFNQLSAQVAELKGVFEQTVSTQSPARSVVATFDR